MPGFYHVVLPLFHATRLGCFKIFSLDLAQSVPLLKEYSTLLFCLDVGGYTVWNVSRWPAHDTRQPASKDDYNSQKQEKRRILEANAINTYTFNGSTYANKLRKTQMVSHHAISALSWNVTTVGVVFGSDVSYISADLTGSLRIWVFLVPFLRKGTFIYVIHIYVMVLTFDWAEHLHKTEIITHTFLQRSFGRLAELLLSPIVTM